jgi:hypothetical protein
MPLRPNTMTYGELSIEVKRLFGDESGVQLEAGDILRWANQGLREIVVRNKVLKASATSVTAVGTDLYTFPDQDIYEIASIQLDGQSLQALDYSDAERRIMTSDPQKTERGRPQFWYTWGNEFWLWPVPDQAYPMALRYTKVPTKLTGTDSEVLEISDEYFPVLVDYILGKAYEMDEDWTAAQNKATAFDNAINQQGEKERDAQDSTYPVIAEVDYC